MRRFGAGAIAALVYAVAGLIWTFLELARQDGFQDTDDPAVSLQYLRTHAEVYAQAGLALFVMAIALTVVVYATSDALAGRVSSLVLRTTTAGGLFAAACLFLFGVMRFGVLPLLYIDGLDSDWGEAAYLVSQMAGIHGVAQGAIFTTSLWIVAVAALGWQARILPRWLGVLALVPAIRLVALLGPFSLVPEGTWFVYMLAIPGSFIWFALLGATMLRRPVAPAPGGAPTPTPSPTPALTGA